MNVVTMADVKTGEIMEIPTIIERRATCLIISDETTFEQWADVGQWLQSVERSVMWWIGDWVRFGEHRYGEKYAQAIEATGHSYSQLSDAVWVSKSYEFSDRSENLSWTHHMRAASLPKTERMALLSKAENSGWSVRELKAQVNRIKNEARLPAAAAPVAGRKVFDFDALARNGEKFGTVYADPPWLYDNQSTRARCDLPLLDMPVANEADCWSCCSDNADGSKIDSGCGARGESGS